ncbi:hypothetical protein QTG54_016587 [Skeletonema marinoi]|uniref:Uncharacterized protein n=1 Tax=Skeletonema marinoi TaxID=267567 RepID=A0AAD8XSN0_9STRA|nr:hypothetical protein QTG54_016587 [Skeletonema marinoi]
MRLQEEECHAERSSGGIRAPEKGGGSHSSCAAATKKNYFNVTSTQTASTVSTRTAHDTALTANVKTATAKRERQLSISSEDDVLQKKSPTRKQYRYPCSTEGCTSISKKGGVCIRHGAKAPYKLCSSEGCKIQARARGYVGRMGRRNAQRGSFAIAMDAQVKLKREKEQCSTKAVAYKPRSSEGCKTQARAGGVCWTHGTMKRKRCRIEGCTNISKKGVIKGGVCQRHGRGYAVRMDALIELSKGESLHEAWS